MIRFLPQIVILIFSIVFHEFAHGRIALWRGDATAKEQGRLTLNPIPHIDPFGSILLPLFLIVTRSPILFAWAKPVPINPLRFKDIKKDIAIVGASGPISNFVLAVLAAILFRLFTHIFGGITAIHQMLVLAVLINLVLACFNLIPIPPLDGSRVVAGLLPDNLTRQYLKIERYGMLIIFGFLFLGLFRLIIWPIVSYLFVMLLGQEGLYLLAAMQ
jgi:Zn-dependent protease